MSILKTFFFFKKQIYKFFNHIFSDYIINLKNDKQSFLKSIYFLLKNELIALRTYLTKNLRNDFIRSSKSFAKTFILFIKQIENFHLCVNY